MGFFFAHLSSDVTLTTLGRGGVGGLPPPESLPVKYYEEESLTKLPLSCALLYYTSHDLLLLHAMEPLLSQSGVVWRVDGELN